MQYLLIIQFPESSENSFDRLIEIESLLEEQLGADAEIDGHDIGRGEMNIFILTENPIEIFDKVKIILTDQKVAMNCMKAAYRNIESNDFICLWPENLTEFNII